MKRYIPNNDKRRIGYTISRKRLRPIMPPPDARKSKAKPRAPRDDKAERAKMGVTQTQSEYIDRWVLTGGKDPKGLTHAQLCFELEITEQTARNWLKKNQSFQAEAHRRVGNDVGSPINLQRMWDVLLRSACGDLEGQEGPNPVDAKAALGLMEKAGFLTPPAKDDAAPDLSNMSDEELMELAISAVVRAYPSITQEAFVDTMVHAWENFFGEWDDGVEDE